MKIKSIFDNLMLLPDVKIDISHQLQDETTQWQVREVVKLFEISNDYALFLKEYNEIGIRNQSIELYIMGIGHMSEQFGIPEPLKKDTLIQDTAINTIQLRELIHSIHFAGITLYESEKLAINVYFTLNLVAPIGIHYQIQITDFLSGLGMDDGKNRTVDFQTEYIFYVSDFTAFILKIPKLITQKGLQELITKANIDFDIDKVGSYGHLRKPLLPVIDDGLPF